VSDSFPTRLRPHGIRTGWIGWTRRASRSSSFGSRIRVDSTGRRVVLRRSSAAWLPECASKRLPILNSS